MKICMAADIHIGVPDKIDDIIWALEKMRKYCLDNDISKIVILGDLTHDRENIRNDHLNRLVDFLISTDESGINIICFPGNHDMYLKNSWDINFLRPLSRYMTLHNDISSFTINDRKFNIVPFIYSESNYMDEINKLSENYNNGDVLLTHIGVRSSTLNSCFLLKSWNIVDFSNTPFTHVFTGHFHIHQKVGNNVIYPGSIIPFKFDEGNVDHGFIVLDTDDLSYEFISIWDGSDDYKAPQYLTIDDSDINNVSEDDLRNNMVRIALNKEYTMNQMNEIRESLIRLGAKNVKWMNMTKKDDEDNKLVGEVTGSMDKLFDRFIEVDSDGIKGLNKNLLVKLNNIVISDASKMVE